MATPGSDTDKPLETSITTIVKDSGALDLAADAAEQALDTFLTEGPLKEIPIFKYFLTVWRAAPQIRDLLLAKKIAKFLKPLRDIPKTEREEFIHRLEKEPEFQRDVGAHLLLVIDRLDNMSKPQLLAGAFRAYIESTISWQQFQDLAVVVDRCVVGDLVHLKEAARPASFPPAVASRLAGCGVIEIAVIPAIRGAEAVNQYLLTDLGELIVALGLNRAAEQVTGAALFQSTRS